MSRCCALKLLYAIIYSNLKDKQKLSGAYCTCNQVYEDTCGYDTGQFSYGIDEYVTRSCVQASQYFVKMTRRISEIFQFTQLLTIVYEHKWSDQAIFSTSTTLMLKIKQLQHAFHQHLCGSYRLHSNVLFPASYNIYFTKSIYNKLHMLGDAIALLQLSGADLKCIGC